MANPSPKEKYDILNADEKKAYATLDKIFRTILEPSVEKSVKLKDRSIKLI